MFSRFCLFRLQYLYRSSLPTECFEDSKHRVLLAKGNRYTDVCWMLTTRDEIPNCNNTEYGILITNHYSHIVFHDLQTLWFQIEI